MTQLYFEDVDEGMAREVGAYEVTKEEIIEFGERFDPQPYHVDEEVATERFGGLIASGLHTLSICQRIVADHLFRDVVTKAGAGFEAVQCTAPVYAGDTLSVRMEILEKRTLESYPDRGLVRIQYRGLNQNDEQVLSTVGLPFFERRETKAD
ncbi:MaoC/PaaZ C-terminal domain-containing protein [Natrinema gelatinilyticum]|uniref:MaoC/PaaZ C-terminal domain-containing protein n=1 Tax=Natrinema gelatinilyticum TaxID=2961571 RepID=UPI0020C485EA|nr:MaoC/PaaZ C-terminal domain-containing protein [Natrinema gelatinilyticum]